MTREGATHVERCCGSQWCESVFKSIWNMLRLAAKTACIAFSVVLPAMATTEPIDQTSSFLGITLGAAFPDAMEICEPSTISRCVRPNGANYFEMRNAPDLGFPYKVVVLAQHGKAAEMLLSFSRSKLPLMQSLLIKRFGEPTKTETNGVDFSLERGVDVSRDSLWIGSKLVLWLSEVDSEAEGGSMLQALRTEHFQAIRREADQKAGDVASQL